jgi:hypothetical protein
MNYAVKPEIYNKNIPSNLYLIASAGDESWGPQYTRRTGDFDHDVPLWARRIGDDFWLSAIKLRESLEALEGDWMVFFDTDHLASSPLTLLALGSADATVVPLSIDESDFSRLFHDPTNNALFSHVMVPMAENERLRAKISTFIFTKVVECIHCGLFPHSFQYFAILHHA